MIKGIGIDIAELSRIEELISRQPRFPKRILTEEELAKYDKLSETRKIEYLAGRFSAKEAYSKAKGTGIGKEFSFHDISITSDQNGKPIVKCRTQENNDIIHISISHSKAYVVSQVIIETLES